MAATNKHPNSRNRKIDGNKALARLETKLKPLQRAFPEAEFHGYDHIDRARDIWEQEIVPLTCAGILKECDRSAVLDFVELAAQPVMHRSGTRATYLSKLRDQLGLTPKSRLNLTNAETPTGSSLADIMKARNKSA